MLVQARCTAKCWDGGGEIYGYPFLCSPGEDYMIPSDGQLAALTVSPVAYDDFGNAVRFYKDRDGSTKSTKIPKPPFIFEFDRTATRTNQGDAVEKDYSCKVCGMKFNTLNAVGTHTRKVHKNIQEEQPEVEDASA